jgi:hypothetical protein
LTAVTREEVADSIGEDALFIDGFDDALIGYVQRFNTSVALYNVNKVIEILIENGMSIEEAWEYFNFNIVGAWVGEFTPAFAYLQ